MKLRKTALLMSILLIIPLIATLFTVNVVKASPTKLYIPEKIDLMLGIGETFTVDIMVDVIEWPGLWGAQFELTFNPDVIQGVDKEVNLDFLGSWGGTAAETAGPGFNNTLGRLGLFTMSLMETGDDEICPQTTEPVWLAKVTFEVAGLGESDITLEPSTKLKDPWADEIPLTALEHGYFRNVDSAVIPQPSFTVTSEIPPYPLQGFNTTFTAEEATGKTIITYRWYFWRILRLELFWPIVTSVDTVTRNYTVAETHNVTLTVIDDEGVVGTKTGYVRIYAHDVAITAIATNTTLGVYPQYPYADIGEVIEVNVTAENQGDFPETFNVTAFWSRQIGTEMVLGSIGTEIDIALDAGTTTILKFYWDTEGFNLTHPETFGIRANASVVPYEYDKEWKTGKRADNEFVSPYHRIRFHDIAITDVRLFNYLLIKPDGDGTYTQWIGNYQDWDDQPPGHDGDDTYVSAAAKDLNESSTLRDHTAETWSIEKVKVTIVARTNVTTDEQVQLMLVIGGARWISTTKHTLKTTYSEYSSEWEKNPVTSSAWTWSDIDALEAGVKSTQYGLTWTGEIRVTQLYVEVLGPPSTQSLSVTPGDIVGISVTAQNQGDFNETSVTVAVYYDDNLIDTKVIPYMENKTYGDQPRPKTWEWVAGGNWSDIVIIPPFLWNTTGVTQSAYRIKANATAVPDDYDTSDNTFFDNVVLVGPEPEPHLVDGFMVATSSNSTVTDMTFLGPPDLELWFNVAGPDGTKGFTIVVIPKALLWGEMPLPYKIYINDTLIDYTWAHNDTHAFVNLFYDHSTQTVRMVSVDTKPPYKVVAKYTDSLVDDDDKVTEGEPVSFSGTGSQDEVGIVSWTWTFTDVTPPEILSGENKTYTFETPSEPGVYTVTLNVSDAKGQWNSTQIDVKVWKDDIDPTARIDEPANETTIDEDTLVTFDASSSGDMWTYIANYTWNFGDGSPLGNGSITTHKYTEPGNYTVKLTVTDKRGNQGTDDIVIIILETVLDVTSPVADAGSDQTVDEDKVVTFDGSDSDDNVGIVSYVWTFTDAGVLKTLTGEEPTYTFETPGAYTVTLNVTDAAGNWATDTVVITVKDVTKPVADAGADRTVDVNTEVSFDASGSSDNVGIDRYLWNFGDGTSGTGKTVTHTYTEPGTYTVTLTVRDDAGNWNTDTVEVTVEGPPSPFNLYAVAAIVIVIAVAGILVYFLKFRKP